MPIRVTILGATGSIGRSALDLVRAAPEAYEIVGLSAHSDTDTLIALAREFDSPALALTDPDAAERVAAELSGTTVLSGPEGLAALARKPVDIVLAGVVGAAGLEPVLAAIEAGNRVALANKEPMVMAGRLIVETARREGVRILPVDSEHNAIFQCIEGHSIDDIRCVHLTASGGPFYGRTAASLAHVRPEEATNHPTWDMGAKISVDSATLMNKGLEVIEAHWLFGLEFEQIQVVIHPQSVVHSLVEFTDGNVLAHLGVTDMRLPIQFALHWPERVRSPFARLDLTKLPALEFAEPSFGEFPCLGIALGAARRGGTAPSTMNAANETAVEAFMAGRIGFMDIPDIVERVLSSASVAEDDTLERILEADRDGRAAASELVASKRVTPIS